MNKHTAKHIVQCEAVLLLTAMKRRLKNIPDEKSDPLYFNLLSLKSHLSKITDLSELKPLQYLTPFLDVISSGDMIGLITGLALSAVEKFLSFQYLSDQYVKDKNVLQEAIETVANTVTNTKFVGTDHSSDEVILSKILKLLDTIMHLPSGCLISDYTVCKIISSCFRICFEPQLTELLRHTAECTLERIVHLLFSRLPELKDDFRPSKRKNLTINLDLSSINNKSRLRRKAAPTNLGFNPDTNQLSDDNCSSNEALDEPVLIDPEDKEPEQLSDELLLTQEPSEISKIELNEPQKITPPSCDKSKVNKDHVTIVIEENYDLIEENNNETFPEANKEPVLFDLKCCSDESLNKPIDLSSPTDNLNGEQQYRTEKGIVFKSDIDLSTKVPEDNLKNNNTEILTSIGSMKKRNKNNKNQDNSYGLACVQKLLSNLIMLIAPENTINYTNHVRTGLTLLTAALESVGQHIVKSTDCLLPMIQNELAKHLILLLQSDRLSFFAASTRVCFLLFESMRHYLKYQLEMYVSRMISLILSDNDQVLYEYRELALESLVQLWMIPGFITELYINYDCQLYCHNLLQDICDLFYRITIPDRVGTFVSSHSGSSGTSTTSGMMQSSGQSIANSSGGMVGVPSSGGNIMGVSGASSGGTANLHPRIASYLINMQIMALDCLLFMINSIHNNMNRNYSEQSRSANSILLKKKQLKLGTNKFNVDFKDGLDYLKKCGFCRTPEEIAEFLYVNYNVDKKMIGELIGKRSSGDILEKYIAQFNCKNVRMDCAMRTFLEEFRLPGDAANIDIIIESLSKAYLSANPHIVSNDTESYIMFYVIVILNVSHHNNNAKKQAPPMTLEGFKKMLKDGKCHVSEDIVKEIYDSIKNEEIVLPIEQKGLIKENYLWKRLLRRTQRDSTYNYPSEQTRHQLSFELYNLLWKSSVNAFVYIFETQTNHDISTKVKHGLYQCASIAAFYNLTEIMDKILIYVSKYTNFTSPQETVEMFGRSDKTQLAAVTIFELTHKHADIIRDGWKNILDCLIGLFKAKLLPRVLVEVEDLITKDKILLPIEDEKLGAAGKRANETQSMVNWLFSGLALASGSDYSSGGSSSRAAADEIMRTDAMQVIDLCRIPQLIEDTRFIQETSLTELINALIDGTRSGREDLSGTTEEYLHRTRSQPKFDSDPSLVNRAGQDADSYVEDAHNHDNFNDTNDIDATDLYHHHRHGGHNNNIGGNIASTTSSSSSSSRDEQSRVFCLELLIRVLLHNSDRIGCFLPMIYEHFYTLLIGAVRSDLLLERTVVAALRLTIQLLRKEENLDQVFTLLEILALTKMSVLRNVNLHIVCGLKDLMQSYAANIPSEKDWKLLLTLLEMCGAGVKLDPITKAEFLQRLKSKDIANLKKFNNVANLTAAKPCTDHLCKSSHTITTISQEAGSLVGSTSLMSHSTSQLTLDPDTNSSVAVLEHADDSNYRDDINLTATTNASLNRGYTSDGELYKTSSCISLEEASGQANSPSNNKWVLIPPESDPVASYPAAVTSENVTLYSEYPMPQVNQYSIVMSDVQFAFRDPLTVEKSAEILAHLINDPALITPTNFQACVHTLRVFAEACVKSTVQSPSNQSSPHHHHPRQKWPRHQMSGDEDASGSRAASGGSGTTNTGSGGNTGVSPGNRHYKLKSSQSIGSGMYMGSTNEHRRGMSPTNDNNTSGAASSGIPTGDTGSMGSLMTSHDDISFRVSAQLSMLMQTLHIRAKKIYQEWHHNSVGIDDDADFHQLLWVQCWCPLLQGMARLCCDIRAEVRTQAMNVLQNSLSSAPHMFELTAGQWEDCFTKILFPLSASFFDNPSANSANQSSALLSRSVAQLIEISDPRIRAIQILTKVFLQHLPKLTQLSTFTALWLTFLEYMDCYMKSRNSTDSLHDAIRETLKNVLLVMYTGTQDRAILVKSSQIQPSTESATSQDSSHGDEGQLLKLTCDRLSSFLPDLVQELFGEELSIVASPSNNSAIQPNDLSTVAASESTNEQQQQLLESTS